MTRFFGQNIERSEMKLLPKSEEQKGTTTWSLFDEVKSTRS